MFGAIFEQETHTKDQEYDKLYKIKNLKFFDENNKI